MRHGTTGYNTTQTRGITVQYNTIHRDMAQNILLKPVIPSPHPNFQSDPFLPSQIKE